MINKFDHLADELEGLLAKPELGGQGWTLKRVAAWLYERGVTQGYSAAKGKPKRLAKSKAKPVTEGMVQDWWAPRRAKLEERRDLRMFLTDARNDAQATLSMPGAQGDIFLQAGLVKIGALVMKLADSTKLDPESVGQIKDLWGSLVAGIREKRSAESLALDREKFVAGLRSKIEAGIQAIHDEIKGDKEAEALVERLKERVSKAVHEA